MREPNIQSNADQAGATSPGIRRALHHIERNYTDPLHLDALAALAGLSVCRFVTVFRRQVGLTPHRFICRCRVRLAKALLCQGMPAAQAATEAGFFDQSHLSRHFKSFCGVTPGRYLREHAQMPPPALPAPARYAPTASA